VVEDAQRGLAIELRPRLADPRFAWRAGDVPAASHPTVAAALVRVAGVRPDDVAWDPFLGSGAELAERALAGPYAALHGTDRDPSAVAVARRNLEAAAGRFERAHISLRAGDSLVAGAAPIGATLIITNPPMGRRVERGADLGTLYDRFLDVAAAALVPGGRLVWASALPGRTTARAVALGLQPSRRIPVDLGGFEVEIQRLDAPKRR
jgi:23S rRNA G2445 N2-methylase RlmL